MLPSRPVAPDERLAPLDILRGFALLGILTMNITAGQPGGARLNPLVSGGFSGLDFAVWLAGYLLFDEKMITVFSMLFGAGLLLVTERAQKAGLSPRTLFYRRSFFLLLIGLVHAYLIWEGDILVVYALCGMAMYPLRRKSPRSLLLIAAGLWLVLVPLQVGFAEAVRQSREAAIRVDGSPNPAAEDREKGELWGGMRKGFQPTGPEIEQEIRARLAETYTQSVVRRAPEALVVQTVLFLASMFWTVSARMLMGVALLRLGVLSGVRPAAYYLRLAMSSYAIGMPLVAAAVYLQIDRGFDIVFLFGRTFLLNAFASIFVATGHVGLLIWVYKKGWLKSLLTRLAAVGRMALTNYLMHSVICTLLFYSYGLGLFGQLSKAQLFGIVVGIWAIQLAYSPLWLHRFRFGPVEWLWRSATYGRWQPLRATPSANA